MSHTIVVHVVHHLQHLLEVVSARLYRELLQRNIVEEFASINQLHSDVSDWNFRSISFSLYRIGFILNQIHHIRMLEILVDFDFLL